MNSPCAGKNTDRKQDRNETVGVVHFSDELKLSSCKSVLEQGLFTHHVDKVPPIVVYCERPVLETQ